MIMVLLLMFVHLGLVLYIDYLLLYENDFVLAQIFTVNSFDEWSDHAPISFCIPIYCHIDSEHVDYSTIR